MKNNTKRFILSIFVLMFLTANISYAAEFSLVQCAGGNNQCTLNDLFHIVIRIINFAVGASWLVAIWFFFWGSYGLATSYGNSEKIEGSKKVIQLAIVGFFLIMIAFLLINWVTMVLGGYSFAQMLQFLPFK